MAVKLSTYEGKTIDEICGSNFVDTRDNHCAHFVSHVLELEFGYTCKEHTGQGVEGACLRVQELFSQCPSVGKWVARGHNRAGLLFITAEKHVNLLGKAMVDHPQKHVGIYIQDSVWHYPNSQGKVIKQRPQDFLTYFQRLYIGIIGMYYGTFPSGSPDVEM